jgi:hypothetical protein
MRIKTGLLKDVKQWAFRLVPVVFIICCSVLFIACRYCRWVPMNLGGIDSANLIDLQAVVDWPIVELEFTSTVSDYYLDIRMAREDSCLQFRGDYHLNEVEQRTRFNLPQMGVDSLEEIKTLQFVWREPDGSMTTIPMVIKSGGYQKEVQPEE